MKKQIETDSVRNRRQETALETPEEYIYGGDCMQQNKELKGTARETNIRGTSGKQMSNETHETEMKSG